MTATTTTTTTEPTPEQQAYIDAHPTKDFYPHRRAGAWQEWDRRTPGAVRAILSNDRYSSSNPHARRLRLYYGETDPSKPDVGRDWEETYQTTGTVGWSTGWVSIPLMIHNRRSMGGGAILTDCIVRITEAAGGRELYRHPNYHRTATTEAAK